MLSRRQFLKHSALLMSSLAAPYMAGQLTGKVVSADGSDPSQAWLQNYLAALDLPQFAPLNDIYDDLNDDNGNLSLIVYDIFRNKLLSGIQTEAPMPVASAFKGPLFIYFLDQIDPSVWLSLPVEYWRYEDVTGIPQEYRVVWYEHRYILNDLYRTVVLSENDPTGRVLSYVAHQLNSRYPLALFNDWSHEVVGISQVSSMSRWNNGIAGSLEPTDERYANRTAILNHQMVTFNNLATARDLGLYYVWWQSQMSFDTLRVGQELLSMLNNERRSNLERLAYQFNGVAYSKNGSLAREETGVSTVVTDVGLVSVPDQEFYLVAFMSGNADSRTPAYFERIGGVIRGDFQEIVNRQRDPRLEAFEQARFYEEYLQIAYPDQPEIYTDRWNYAFVKYEGVSVYNEPNDSVPIRNPVISASRFGVHLLMQGAMVRYIPVNKEWAELVPDSEQDNVRVRLGDPLFVRRRDLHPISTRHGATIPYFVDSTITSADKLIIIEVASRQMTLMERTQPVIKSPIVLHDINTPRGGHITINKYFACSMQPWAPGVPFTTYFHEGGYAIHGSPWQRWEKTVNTANIAQRTSAGCVNVPNWTVTLGQYTRPLDELVFRWLGGSNEPENNVYEYGTREHPTVWIYLVDDLRDLNQFYRPPKYREEYITWDQIRHGVREVGLMAPGAFFNV